MKMALPHNMHMDHSVWGVSSLECFTSTFKAAFANYAAPPAYKGKDKLLLHFTSLLLPPFDTFSNRERLLFVRDELQQPYTSLLSMQFMYELMYKVGTTYYCACFENDSEEALLTAYEHSIPLLFVKGAWLPSGFCVKDATALRI